MGFICVGQFTPAGEKLIVQELFPDLIARAIVHKPVAASFYSTLKGAVGDVNSGTIGANADADESGAVACVYIDHGQPNVVLMKDTEEATRTAPAVAMTINLNGHALSISDKVGIDVTGSSDIIIDGRKKGSMVRVSRTDGGNTKAIQLKTAYTGNCIVRGGEYVGISKGAVDNACIAVLNGKLNLSNATVIVEDATGKADGIIVNPNGTMSMSHCNVRVNSNLSESHSSYGVSNLGTLTINDCYVMGDYGGIINHGTLYVRGGVYEGGCSGGLVASEKGRNYLRDATFREYDMPDEYTGNHRMRCTGLFIGGTGIADNLNVYVDNCDIYGSVQPIMLYGDNGEENNSLYISNSRINLDYTGTGVRIDNDTHKVYLGVGNNFTAEHTNRPESVITTNGVYVNVMPNE